MKQWSGKGEIQLQHHGQRRPRPCSPVFDSEHYPRRKADDIKIDTPHSKKTATSAYKSWSKGQQWCVVRWTGDAASRGPTIEGESRMFDEVSPPRSAGIWCRNHFTNSIITDFAKAVNSRRRNLLNRIWEYHRLVNGPMFLGWNSRHCESAMHSMTIRVFVSRGSHKFSYRQELVERKLEATRSEFKWILHLRTIHSCASPRDTNTRAAACMNDV